MELGAAATHPAPAGRKRKNAPQRSSPLAIGDWILAYLSGSAFFAIGQICAPRDSTGKTIHTDTVARTVKEGRHLHFDGVVRYADAPAFYEDFTDPWKLPLDPSRQGQPPHRQYAQRVDVARWENVVPDGIEMTGLAAAAPLPEYRKPIFQVDAEFFHDVAEELRVESVNT